MIDELAQTLTGYWGLFVLCALCGIALPIPEDVVLVWTGIRVASGHLALAPTVVVVGVGILTRDILGWAIGRWLGSRLLQHPRMVRWVGAARFARASAMLQNKGNRAVFLARGLVGMRLPVFVLAGAAGVPFAQFVLWDALGLVVSTTVLLAIGLYAGVPALETLRWLLRTFGWLPLLLVVLGALVVVIKLRTTEA